MSEKFVFEIPSAQDAKQISYVIAARELQKIFMEKLLDKGLPVEIPLRGYDERALEEFVFELTEQGYYSDTRQVGTVLHISVKDN